MTTLRHCYAEKMLVVLRDGRKLVGYLRTLDQFGVHAFQFYDSIVLLYSSMNVVAAGRCI